MAAEFWTDPKGLGQIWAAWKDFGYKAPRDCRDRCNEKRGVIEAGSILRGRWQPQPNVPRQRQDGPKTWPRWVKTGKPENPDCGFEANLDRSAQSQADVDRFARQVLEKGGKTA